MYSASDEKNSLQRLIYACKLIFQAFTSRHAVFVNTLRTGDADLRF